MCFSLWTSWHCEITSLAQTSGPEGTTELLWHSQGGGKLQPRDNIYVIVKPAAPEDALLEVL